MTTSRKNFTVSIDNAMSGIELVNLTGPLIEQWNKDHDRKSALWCENKECDGKVLNPLESFKHSDKWVLHMVLEGTDVQPGHVEEVTHLLQQTITPNFESSSPSM